MKFIIENKEKYWCIESEYGTISPLPDLESVIESIRFFDTLSQKQVIHAPPSLQPEEKKTRVRKSPGSGRKPGLLRSVILEIVRENPGITVSGAMGWVDGDASREQVSQTLWHLTDLKKVTKRKNANGVMEYYFVPDQAQSQQLTKIGVVK